MNTDEELLSLAEEFHARGELSVNHLKREAGGGQRERLMTIANQVR